MDWSLRPAGQVWLDLTQNQWWTETQGRTGANGDYATRGFLGDYEITVGAAGTSKTVMTRLPNAGIIVQITLN